MLLCPLLLVIEMFIIDWLFDFRLCKQRGIFDSLFGSSRLVLHIFHILCHYYLFIVLTGLLMSIPLFSLLNHLYLIFLTISHICY